MNFLYTEGASCGHVQLQGEGTGGGDRGRGGVVKEGVGGRKEGMGRERGGGGSKERRGKSVKVSTSQCKLVMQQIHVQAHQVP